MSDNTPEFDKSKYFSQVRTSGTIDNIKPCFVQEGAYFGPQGQFLGMLENQKKRAKPAVLPAKTGADKKRQEVLERAQAKLAEKSNIPSVLADAKKENAQALAAEDNAV